LAFSALFNNNMNIQLESMAIEMPAVSRHPNRQPFHGVLTLVDAPSTRPPAGARGHRVPLSRAAADRALASLLGMGLGYTPSLDGHDARRKVGIITSAEIVQLPVASRQLPVGGQWVIEISGYLFARDFPELMQELRSNGRGLGMSYEIADARVADVRASIWVLTDVTFTGAAILRREKAAYPETWIELQASAVVGFRSSGSRPTTNDQRPTTNDQRLQARS
jgi:hypothetical protein